MVWYVLFEIIIFIVWYKVKGNDKEFYDVMEELYIFMKCIVE